MDEYLIPTQNADAEMVEKKSRFIGHIFLTETEEEALFYLKEMRDTYWDATHNVYAYVIKDGRATQIDLYIMDMTKNEREIVKAGCLINFNRNRNAK